MIHRSDAWQWGARSLGDGSTEFPSPIHFLDNGTEPKPDLTPFRSVAGIILTLSCRLSTISDMEMNE